MCQVIVDFTIKAVKVGWDDIISERVWSVAWQEFVQ